MVPRSFGPGDDIDAWCGKCLMVMNHRIIAMVGGVVKKVECLTCHAVHAYKTGVGDKRKDAASARSTPDHLKTGRGAAAPARASRLESEWKAFMTEAPEDLVARRYSVFDAFEAAEFIEHPTFGIGKVLEIAGADRIVVIFKEGRKTLVCNRTRRAD
ncbi:MAG: hypothetical protein ACP5U1_14665 [Desulfomonilaceae bacterium]